MTQKIIPKSDAIFSAENIVEFPQSRFSASAKAAHIAGISHVNCNELTSIKALTAYIAHNKNIAEEVVRTFLLAQFKVADMAKLRRDDFEPAIRFLVDLQVDLIVN